MVQAETKKKLVFKELWRALGQVVPRVESTDTLGTVIATALYEITGVGKAAVVLRTQLFPGELSNGNHSPSFFLRLISKDPVSGPLIYLEENKGLLALLSAQQEPLSLCQPWPEELLKAGDKLLQQAHHQLTLVPIPRSNLRSEPEPRGAICLLDVPADKLPDPSDLMGLASFTGIALDLLASKARTARQEVEYTIISDIGRSLTSSLSLDDIFGHILSSVRTTIDAAEVSVGLIDKEAQELVFEKSLMGPQFTGFPPLRLKIDQGIAGWVARHGQPLNVPDVAQDPRWYSKVDASSGFVTHSILCVPLKVEGQVIGVLEAMNKRSGTFTAGDERLLAALGSSVAIAIEKARLHADVLAEKRRMEAIFSNMSEGLLTMNPNGRITAVNPALQSMVGAAESRLTKQLCYKAIQTEPAALEDLVDQFNDPEKQGAAFHAACDILRQDGIRIPVLISSAATFDDSGTISEISTVFSDISQVLELERMKDDFIANVTHELRTPLAAILLYARLLRAGKSRNDPVREARYLKIVEEQSNQLQQLVRQVLDLARMKATFSFTDQEHIQLHSLLDKVLAPLEKIANQKGLTIQRKIDANLPLLASNREALRLIFKNLIDNAIKFTSKGEIQILAQAEQGQLRVAIIDQGMGISPESIPHLFQRFYRTQAAVERGIGGTGLGLALVKEAIDKIGGEVEVCSQTNKGSTFSVVLPIVRPS